jgi:hypothetical protein
MEYEEKMVAYVQPNFAIVHSEYLYNADLDEICIVESALRGGGVYISSHLVPLHCGIDINEVLLDCVVGKEVDIPSVLSMVKYKASGYVCYYLPEGQVKSISGFDEVKKMKCVKMIEEGDIVVGMKTLKLTHKGQRLGPIIVEADNRSQLEKNITNIQATLKVIVDRDVDEMYGIKWN